MGRAFAKGLQGLGGEHPINHGRDETKQRTPTQLELQREQVLLKEIPEMSNVMKKASQIPLRMEYDKRKMRQNFSKFFNKHYNTESDDSDYVEHEITLMMKRNSAGSSAGANKIMNRAIQQLNEKKGETENTFFRYGQLTQHI